MTQSRHLALPPNLPPRLINREAAAAYVSLSPGSFDQMMEEGKMPKPKQLTARRSAWDVRELDVYVDNLPQVGDAGADDTSWD
jgi:predicted DNA-binding transcriptional regulator AlpA